MGAGVVVLREGFEASLVVGIVLAFLDRTGRRDGFGAVWVGVAAALALSLAVGAALFAAGAELEGRSEAVFEGVVMLTAAGLLTWMIFWMRGRARTLRKEIEGRAQAALDAGSALGLAIVVFIGVAREGVETALFLFSSIEGSSSLVSLVGALLGGAAAVGLGYLFYRGSHRLNLRTFFTATSVLLLVFAGYLLASGLHELAEAGVVPESEALLVAAFAALAAPTLYFFFRKPRAVATG
ncbi:MAG TPA: FTR1 family protein [Gaiellaceae bacterium]|jgi:high-affinity iron transporter|nr:FTR1 family protein [Gaiellaceae bacterium]